MAVFPLAQIPIVPASEDLRIKANQSMQMSQFSGSQAVVHYYSSWTLSVNWSRIKSTVQADALATWLDQLQGSLGTFHWTPRTGVMAVSATLHTSTISYPYATVVSMSGWAPGAATQLRPGGYFQLGAQLLRIATTPTNADNTGSAVVEFYPPLRSQLASGSSVITTSPMGLFRLAPDSDGSGYQVDPDHVPEFSKLTAIEVI